MNKTQTFPQSENSPSFFIKSYLKTPSIINQCLIKKSKSVLTNKIINTLPEKVNFYDPKVCSFFSNKNTINKKKVLNFKSKLTHCSTQTKETFYPEKVRLTEQKNEVPKKTFFKLTFNPKSN